MLVLVCFIEALYFVALCFFPCYVVVVLSAMLILQNMTDKLVQLGREPPKPPHLETPLRWCEPDAEKRRGKGRGELPKPQHLETPLREGGRRGRPKHWFIIEKLMSVLENREDNECPRTKRSLAATPGNAPERGREEGASKTLVYQRKVNECTGKPGG